MPCAITSLLACAGTAISHLGGDHTTDSGNSWMSPCVSSKSKKIRFKDQELGLTSKDELDSYKQDEKDRAMNIDDDVETLSYYNSTTPPALEDAEDERENGILGSPDSGAALLTPPSNGKNASLRLLTSPKCYPSSLSRKSSPSSSEDLTVLTEVDENQYPRQISSPSSSTKPKSILRPSTAPPPMEKTSSCSGIWLCSAPRKSQSPSISRSESTTSIASLPVTSAEVTCSSSAARLARPVIVRSMSTGRLAFDAQGRVQCLSSHSERMVKRPTPAPRLSTMGRSTTTKYRSTSNPSYPSSRCPELQKDSQDERVERVSSRAASPSPSVQSDSAVDISKKKSLGGWAKKGWKSSGLKGVLA
ncbi:hypothetical protein CI109_106939 [Kwoniella shandongensis]|uniref:Uncharacterized protein n=1 Tax=Kwoniella shandongensis TaxID=1734106 RepID=A0A5M6C663_9TREE|nr:uncharacterized protein CI109_000807 [Kwoniella shandongensis]KAA5530627.1 hypothetical protein CI109_000807 [Kwoniella shandongensis]